MRLRLGSRNDGASSLAAVARAEAVRGRGNGGTNNPFGGFLRRGVRRSARGRGHSPPPSSFMTLQTTMFILFNTLPGRGQNETVPPRPRLQNTPAAATATREATIHELVRNHPRAQTQLSLRHRCAY